MKKQIVVLMLLTASLASAATKSDLKDSLIATSNYLYVGDPISKAAKNPMGDSCAWYAIPLLIQSLTDSLVVQTTQAYIWVLHDDQLEEQAYFNRSNFISPPTVAISFTNRVINYMVANSIEGHIVEAGTLGGNIEWAVVIRYVPGSDAQHVASETVWVTRTNGTAWSMKVIE